MSEARELLKKACEFLGNPVICGEDGVDLYEKIQAELSKPEPEPVAWMCKNDPDAATAFSWKRSICKTKGCFENRVPLYPHHPSQQNPLSDDEIKLLWEESLLNTNSVTLKFARSIEQAYGIGVDK